MSPSIASSPHFSLRAKRNDFSAHCSTKQQDKQISVYAREPEPVAGADAKAEPAQKIQGRVENIDKTAASFNVLPFQSSMFMNCFCLRLFEIGTTYIQLILLKLDPRAREVLG